MVCSQIVMVKTCSCQRVLWPFISPNLYRAAKKKVKWKCSVFEKLTWVKKKKKTNMKEAPQLSSYLSSTVPSLAPLPPLNLSNLATLPPLPTMLPSQLPPVLSQGLTPMLPTSTAAPPASVTVTAAHMINPATEATAPTEAGSTSTTESPAPTETTLTSS